uniref:Mads2 n=1 Tax=Arundo donax TaxID=35708 RepID=A0A0A9HNE2_ARUDO
MRPTSASHRMESSLAFLSSPFRLLENVTCLFVELSILLISIFPLPISSLSLSLSLSLSQIY